MANIHIGVIINGATGRMGTTQHMATCWRSPGRRAEAQERRPPDPGADPGRPRRRHMAALAAAHGSQRCDDQPRRGAGRPGQDLHGLLRHRRPARARAQGDRGGQAHPYREADRADRRGSDGAGAARRQGRLKHGVIQDKLFLPGFAKLLFVKNSGFFGRILSVKVDAGSWIFDGTTQECQRPSWNYRKATAVGWRSI